MIEMPGIERVYSEMDDEFRNAHIHAGQSTIGMASSWEEIVNDDLEAMQMADDYDRFVPIEEAVCCDIFGNICSGHDAEDAINLFDAPVEAADDDEFFPEAGLTCRHVGGRPANLESSRLVVFNELGPVQCAFQRRQATRMARRRMAA
ncbi:hypothetical protein C0583_03395 [Candidatus Parcubacteria bacterium]|nr:MAG: hypothetical protein C0583_03395 [Candidatus Parcubacteria bacterium]